MLQNRKVQTALQQADPAGIMIDEAHCICKQGPGFREDYLRIREFVQSLPTPPVVGAFTATATPTTERYILEKLGIEDAHVIRGGVTRDNIELRVIEVGHGLGGREIICNRLRKHKGDRVIIYTNTINRRLIKENQLDLKGAELKERLHALEALHDYACENHKCRWGMIREFFGEKFGKRCKKRCDNCKNR